MQLYYAKSTNGFYAPEVNGVALPADAVEITEEQHQALLAAQSAGQRIMADASGHPIAVDPPAETLDAMVARLSKAIDDLGAEVLGKWSRFQIAYQAREAAARAFKAAGYAGDPGIWITGFATPAKLALKDATDRIIAQADALNAALPLLDSLRMRKYELAQAADASAIQATFDDIAAKINALAASLA